MHGSVHGSVHGWCSDLGWHHNFYSAIFILFWSFRRTNPALYSYLYLCRQFQFWKKKNCYIFFSFWSPLLFRFFSEFGFDFFQILFLQLFQLEFLFKLSSFAWRISKLMLILIEWKLRKVNQIKLSVFYFVLIGKVLIRKSSNTWVMW